MEGQQIPKATMINFIKTHLKVAFSADFSNKLLQISKDYINKITSQANEICSKNNKKTISVEHIEAALANFGLDAQVNELKQMSSKIKEQNQIKQQFRQRIQESIEKNLQQADFEDEGQRVVSIKEIAQMQQKLEQKDSDEIDYEAEINDDDSNQSDDEEMQIEIEKKFQKKGKPNQYSRKD